MLYSVQSQSAQQLNNESKVWVLGKEFSEFKGKSHELHFNPWFFLIRPRNSVLKGKTSHSAQQMQIISLSVVSPTVPGHHSGPQGNRENSMRYTSINGTPPPPTSFRPGPQATLNRSFRRTSRRKLQLGTEDFYERNLCSGSGCLILTL